jgi:hypothetical protein
MRAARASLAAIALVAAGAACAAELGTLFHSAEERARLERLRRGDPAPAEAPSGPEAPAARREITGFVVRSDGRGTAFVDGVPVPVDPRNARLLDPKSMRGAERGRDEDFKVERK